MYAATFAAVVPISAKSEHAAVAQRSIRKPVSLLALSTQPSEIRPESTVTAVSDVGVDGGSVLALTGPTNAEFPCGLTARIWYRYTKPYATALSMKASRSAPAVMSVLKSVHVAPWQRWISNPLSVEELSDQTRST